MADRFAEVAALVADEPEPTGASGPSAGMRRLCVVATRLLRASGTGVTVMASDQVRAMAAASDDETQRLEEIQFITGEGPCMDAFSLRRPVLVPELLDGAMIRWPGFVPALYATGIRAVFAFPLQVGAAQLGMMDVFRRDSGSLSEEELSLAFTFASVAVSNILDGEQVAPLDHVDDDVLGSGAELFQAQGMVMVQLGVSIAEALVRIRAYAYAEARSLHDVAVDIVARRVVFDRDQQP